ncbi:MAG: hypothetical protein NC089_09395 [Bacteroides sp.]|nr:hypothetical protein [Bacteroides sp.]MCM1549629.1 hypothetical protein [Clostridium sp.]
MKITDKKKPIPTMPKGLWESSVPRKNKETAEEPFTNTTDLQGNGYPANQQKH